MTADSKLNRGPSEAFAYRALAALTAPDDGVPGLPVPKRTEFCCDTLTLSFTSLTDAAAWASRLDATRAEYRLPMGRLLYSSWVGSWRGFALLVTATEPSGDIAAQDVAVREPNLFDVLAEDLIMSDGDVSRLLGEVTP